MLTLSKIRTWLCVRELAGRSERALLSMGLDEFYERQFRPRKKIICNHELEDAKVLRAGSLLIDGRVNDAG